MIEIESCKLAAYNKGVGEMVCRRDGVGEMGWERWGGRDGVGEIFKLVLPKNTRDTIIPPQFSSENPPNM